MSYITHVRMASQSPQSHLDATGVQWIGPSSKAVNESSLGQVVDWINSGGDAWVREGFANLRVVVVLDTPHHIRTVANDTFTDHLLLLPRL